MRGLVYHSVPDFAPSADAQADASVDLFQVRVKDFEPLAARSQPLRDLHRSVPVMTGRAGRTFIGETVTMPNGQASPYGRSPMSVIVQRGNRAAVQQRVDTLFASGMNVFGATPTARRRTGACSSSTRPARSSRRSTRSAAATCSSARASWASSGLSVGFLILSTRRAQDLARQQLEFVATVSHELRTPLAVIRSAADNLADGVVNDEARIRQYGQLVRREGRPPDRSGRADPRVRRPPVRAADDDGAAGGGGDAAAGRRRVGAARSRSRPASRSISTSPTTCRPSRRRGGAPARVPEPGRQRDQVRRRRALDWRARRPQRRARWKSASPIAASASPPADQAKIFDPFYRAPDVVAAQIQGAGLGLSLVKRIVEAHGGEVTLKSAPGAGQHLHRVLPLPPER